MVRFSPREAAEASGRTLEARPLPRALGGALTQCPWVQPLHPTLWSATLTRFWFPRTWGLRGHTPEQASTDLCRGQGPALAPSQNLPRA